MFRPTSPSALDRAVSKAFLHLLPLLFVCYLIAYVDRVNVSLAKLNMQQDLAHLGFSESAYGFGMGVFFIGYILLAVPGTLLVERWSARKWISLTMVSWGFIAALTAFVHHWVPGASAGVLRLVQSAAALLDPVAGAHLGWVSSQAQSLAEMLRSPGAVYVAQFWGVRFLLGVAEAGFYPGVIVYLTHWFPRRERSRALAWFFVGTPIAQIVGPPLCGAIMTIGSGGRPSVLGLVGWQWVFIGWGAPAIVLGLIVLAILPDWPHEASWLTPEERAALESQLTNEKQAHVDQVGQVSWWRALAHPKILALALAYFFVVTGNYGIEMYMASILRDWYNLDVQRVAWLVIIPAIGSLIGQIFVGWNSDRTGERRWHASLPIIFGAIALVSTPASQGERWLTIALFTLGMAGSKAYMPAFWTLPSELMSASAAAASIGLINAFGNIGGAVGPTVMGIVRDSTGSYGSGLRFLAVSMTISAIMIIALGVSRQVKAPDHQAELVERRH